MEHYEQQYIEQSGNEKPRAENYKNCIAYDSAYIQWYKGFIDWLCKQLEGVENDKEVLTKALIGTEKALVNKIIQLENAEKLVVSLTDELKKHNLGIFACEPDMKKVFFKLWKEQE